VDTNAYTGDTDPCHFILHLMSYLEAPPFMRKALFPLHPNLALQGLLPSLDMPHHPHQKLELLPYMEGVTMTGKGKGGKGYVSFVPVPCRSLANTLTAHSSTLVSHNRSR
jgi:methyltransferase